MKTKRGWFQLGVRLVLFLSLGMAVTGCKPLRPHGTYNSVETAPTANVVFNN